MRVLVCGGRDYGDIGNVWSQLDALHGIEGIKLIIHGNAAGADRLAANWAASNKVASHPFSANWRHHGRGAGPIRNQRMIDEGKPDLVIAFPGGRGTADMVRRARAAGIEVMEIEG